MDSALQKFERAASVARTADDVWLALSALAAETVGYRLFTVTTVDMKKGLAQRLFTSHPAEYPVSGTKPIHRDRWFDIVHGEGRTFVANTLAEIAGHFPDHGLIASLGCGSVVNIPVVLGGELVATVNLPHQEQWYTPERVALAQQVLALPAMLCCAWTPALKASAEM